MTKLSFDIEAALQTLRDGKDLTGKDGILTPLIKQLTGAAMQAELEQRLAQDETANRKNGSTPKTIKAFPDALNSILPSIGLVPLSPK